MPRYDLSDPDLDARIHALVREAARTGAEPDEDLIAEMIVTALRLHRDRADRADIRLINTALKEMRYSFMVFSRYRDVRKVAVFGSARTPESDPNYLLATEMAGHMATERGWMVMTGAGPGIMEAANRGAGDRSFGVNIRLPFEDEPNPFVPPERLINFRYFFPRKLIFVKEAHAFLLFPGGFGTMDETFETMTLIQTGKSDMHPVVLMEASGTGYWEGFLDFIEESLVRKGMITPDDPRLFHYTTDVAEAAEEICGFYANYHSQRYVDGNLIIRLLHPVGPAQLARLNDEFSQILVDGVIESVPPTPTEVEDRDQLDLPRLRLHFDRRSYGRLRALIDHLNTLAPGSAEEQGH
jgi:uncharacterized protein (TIGR00730 family)